MFQGAGRTLSKIVRPLSAIRRDLWTARCEGRLDLAAPFAIELLEREPEHQTRHLRLVADLYRAANRPSEAVPYWRLLAKADPHDLEAHYQIALFERSSSEAKQSELPPVPDGPLKARLDRLLREPASVEVPKSHHVAIGGVSYCGSTLLERILGSIPDVASIGESHWLIRSRSSGGVNNLLDFTRDPPAGIIRCWGCGDKCAALSVDFRASMLADRSNWYHKIAHRVGAKHLVSSDKNTQKLLDNDPLLEFDLLILYKSPEGAWESQRKHLLEKSRPVDKEALKTYLSGWEKTYQSLLDLKIKGRRVVMSFEDFTREPECGLSRICELFGFPDVPLSELKLRLGHTLGGNAGVNKVQVNGEELVVKPLKPVVLSEAERTVIAEYRPVSEVVERLNRARLNM